VQPSRRVKVDENAGILGEPKTRRSKGMLCPYLNTTKLQAQPWVYMLTVSRPARIWSNAITKWKCVRVKKQNTTENVASTLTGQDGWVCRVSGVDNEVRCGCCQRLIVLRSSENFKGHIERSPWGLRKSHPDECFRHVFLKASQAFWCTVKALQAGIWSERDTFLTHISTLIPYNFLLNGPVWLWIWRSALKAPSVE
jgi:hypothetical protein